MDATTTRRGLIVLVAAVAVFGRPSRPAGEEHAERSPYSHSPQFVGVSGCTAAACHGNTKSSERAEYATWVQRDRHARAFYTLLDEPAKRIGRNLGIDRVETDARCLACHSTALDKPHGPRFVVDDGVSCEACHGAAEKWLGPHSKPQWAELSSQQKSELGMIDTKDLAARAALCVACHVGTGSADVNHDLIAAGHPPLRFELDAYTANMPPHWTDRDEPTTAGAMAWAIGQAVTLEQSLKLLGERARKQPWPEFAEYECAACHHSVHQPTWRQERGYAARPIGSPVWSSPQASLLGRLVPDWYRDADASLVEVRKLMQRSVAPASEVAQAADAAARATAGLIDGIKNARWEAERLPKLLEEIAADSESASLDYSSAAQTTMALGAVFEAIAMEPRNRSGARHESIASLRRALDGVYDAVAEPSKFEPVQFRERLETFRKAIQGGS